MTTLRRVAVAVFLAVAVTLGFGQAAHADCLYPPVVQNPTETDAGQIDPGPTAPSGSTYSQFGYGGLDVIRYESKTCVAGQSITGRPGTGVSGMLYGVGKWAAAGVTAVTVSLAREVFTDGPLWQTVNAMFSPLTAVIPVESFALLSTLIATLAVSVIVVQARKGDKAGWAARRYAGIILIGVVAVGCYTWNRAIPDAWGKTAGVSLLAVQELTSGASGSADVAVGDALTDHVLMPMWAYAQLGSNKDAVDQYAWRLRAASTISRTEAAQITNGETTFKDLASAKENDYRKTAEELKASHPDAYAHLTGADTTGQGWTGVLGGAVAVAAAAVLAVALLVVGVGKVFSVGFVYGFPAVAAFFMWPRLQRVAARLALITWYIALASIAAVFVFVLWMLGPIHGLMSTSEAPMFLRFVALGLVYGALWAAWRLRGIPLKKAREREDVKKALKQVDVVVKEIKGKTGTATVRPAGDNSGEEDTSEVVQEPEVAPATDVVQDDPQERERFAENVQRIVEDEARPAPPPVDDPDVPAEPDAPEPDERADIQQFRDRVNEQFDRMEEDALARRQEQEVRHEEHATTD